MRTYVLLISVAATALMGCARKPDEGLMPFVTTTAYTVRSAGYEHKYGDSVNAEGASREFVICKSCPKPPALTRLLAPAPIALKMTVPFSSPSSTTVAAPPVAPGPPPLSRPGSSLPVDETTSRTEGMEYLPSPSGNIGDGVTASETSGIASLPREDSSCRNFTVLFPFDRHDLDQDGIQVVLQMLPALKGRRVEVIGFTDSHGGKKHNDRLALARAQFVAGMLDKASAFNVTVKAVEGTGRCCYTSHIHRFNRRVEVRCIKDSISKEVSSDVYSNHDSCLMLFCDSSRSRVCISR